jgi:hypothetical protein
MCSRPCAEDPHPGSKFIEEQTLRRIKRESHEAGGYCEHAID